MEPSPFSNFLPVDAIQAARCTNSRDVPVCIFMSASLKAMAWFSMIARPNCRRSLA